MRQVGDDIDTAPVEPFAGNRRRNVRLVLMVGSDDLDGDTAGGSAQILDRHTGRQDRSGSADISDNAALITHHTDDDLVVGKLREGGRCPAAQQ